MNDSTLAFLRMRQAETAVGGAALRAFTDLAEKDLALTLTLAREHGVALPGTGLGQQLMARVYGIEDDKRR
ncbi:MAG: hypothetical protein Q8S13_08570 [Dehalococcoidia bacterium]|nr:hypothetical protein [Dehalococcoidia bacterium]